VNRGQAAGDITKSLERLSLEGRLYTRQLRFSPHIWTVVGWSEAGDQSGSKQLRHLVKFCTTAFRDWQGAEQLHTGSSYGPTFFTEEYSEMTYNINNIECDVKP